MSCKIILKQIEYIVLKAIIFGFVAEILKLLSLHKLLSWNIHFIRRLIKIWYLNKRLSILYILNVIGLKNVSAKFVENVTILIAPIIKITVSSQHMAHIYFGFIEDCSV